MTNTTRMDPSKTPFELLGGADRVNAISKTFYEIMDRDEPALAKLHRLDADGHIAQEPRDKFALFFIGWLGGPQDYVAKHGHPRLRMRHMHVKVDVAMRDAWLRAMGKALDQHEVRGDIRGFLDRQLAGLADHMRNTEG